MTSEVDRVNRNAGFGCAVQPPAVLAVNFTYGFTIRSTATAVDMAP